MKVSALRLYLIADADGAYPDLAERVRAACSGGHVTLVQVRSKSLSARVQVALTRDLGAGLEVPVLVNDRADVAVASGAAGVHVGQSDLAPADARAIVGSNGIVGLTVRSLDEARDAPLDMLDYVSIGGVYATRTKHDAAEPIGLDGLSRIAALLRERDPSMPLCAIAGMNAERAPDVLAAGVDGVCVSSAILAAPDPAEAARAFAERMGSAS